MKSYRVVMRVVCHVTACVSAEAEAEAEKEANEMVDLCFSKVDGIGIQLDEIENVSTSKIRRKP